MKDYVEQYLEAKRLVIEQNRPTCQKRFFQHVADKFLAFAEEKLTEKELKVASYSKVSLYQKSVQKWAVQATASDYAGIR